MDPASIRYNNPGAMWGRNAISRRWGETAAINLNDGLGQGNNIAFFPNKVAGACAQFDLWRTSYTGMTLREAIRKWSGGNWSQPYADFLTQHTGLSIETPITAQLLAGPQGLLLCKYQAQWEAGKPYPLSDTDWHTAQGKVFGSKHPATPAQKKTAAVTGAATGTVVAAGSAAKAGVPLWAILVIITAGVVIAFLLWLLTHRKNPPVLTAQMVPPPLTPLTPPSLKVP